jgi:1-acyl-sn-glycerol-3-phosphate acyltransferase
MGTEEGWFVKTSRAVLSVWIRAGMRLVYRIRVRGIEQLPAGGALLISNHLSHADALWIGAAIRRPVVFLMHRSFFRVPIVGRVARLYGTIPIASEDSAEEKQRSLSLAVQQARAGGLVCIFPEGAISRTGQMLGFRRGMETIAREANVPIQPIVLDRVWGSIFSYERGRFFFKRPRRWPFPLDLAIGAPLACDTPAWRAHEELAALQAQARHLHYASALPLAERLRRVRAPAEHVARFAGEWLRFAGGSFAPSALLAAAQALQQVHALSAREHIWIGCSLEQCPAVLLAALLSGARVSTGERPPADADAWYFDAEQLSALRELGPRPRLAVCLAERRGVAAIEDWPALLWARRGASWGGILTSEVPDAGSERGRREQGFGRALPGTALSVRDESGQRLEPGQPGWLHVLSAFRAELDPAPAPLRWQLSGLWAIVDRDGFLLEA